MKHGANQHRWRTVAKDRALALLFPKIIIDTPAELLLKVLQAGTVSTNIYLRRLHNFCLDMNWLPWPLIPKRQWPVIRFREKRAITWDEHSRIVAREGNPERKAFYPLAGTWGPPSPTLRTCRPRMSTGPPGSSASSAKRCAGGASNPLRFDLGTRLRPAAPTTARTLLRRERDGGRRRLRRLVRHLLTT